MIVSKAICGSVKARGECRLWTDNILVTQEDKRGAWADPNKPLNSAPWRRHFVSFPAHLHCEYVNRVPNIYTVPSE